MWQSEHAARHRGAEGRLSLSEPTPPWSLLALARRPRACAHFFSADGGTGTKGVLRLGHAGRRAARKMRRVLPNSTTFKASNGTPRRGYIVLVIIAPSLRLLANAILKESPRAFVLGCFQK